MASEDKIRDAAQPFLTEGESVLRRAAVYFAREKKRRLAHASHRDNVTTNSKGNAFGMMTSFQRGRVPTHQESTKLGADPPTELMRIPSASSSRQK